MWSMTSFLLTVAEKRIFFSDYLTEHLYSLPSHVARAQCNFHLYVIFLPIQEALLTPKPTPPGTFISLKTKSSPFPLSCTSAWGLTFLSRHPTKQTQADGWHKTSLNKLGAAGGRLLVSFNLVLQTIEECARLGKEQLFVQVRTPHIWTPCSQNLLTCWPKLIFSSVRWNDLSGRIFFPIINWNSPFK